MSDSHPTDTEILDWLSKQKYVTFERHYQCEVSKRTEEEIKNDGYNGHINFFSGPSQHLHDVKTLREAVEIAMRFKPRVWRNARWESDYVVDKALD